MRYTFTNFITGHHSNFSHSHPTIICNLTMLPPRHTSPKTTFSHLLDIQTDLAYLLTTLVDQVEQSIQCVSGQ